MPQKRSYEREPPPETSAGDQPPLAALAPYFEGGMDAILGGLGLRGSITEPTSVPNAVGQVAAIGGPFLKSLGKPVADLLDLILTTKGGRGLPPKLRLTNIGRSGDLQFHNPRTSGVGPAGFEASPSQVDTLIGSGALDIEQPAQRGVDSIRKRLAQEFDAHVSDPRNPTMGLPRENKTPMRRTLDELPDKGRTRTPTSQPRKRR